jgi:hypothetical protein
MQETRLPARLNKSDFVFQETAARFAAGLHLHAGFSAF